MASIEYQNLRTADTFYPQVNRFTELFRTDLLRLVRPKVQEL